MVDPTTLNYATPQPASKPKASVFQIVARSIAMVFCIFAALTFGLLAIGTPFSYARSLAGAMIYSLIALLFCFQVIRLIRKIAKG
jgi:hypothetical protein